MNGAHGKSFDGTEGVEEKVKIACKLIPSHKSFGI